MGQIMDSPAVWLTPDGNYLVQGDLKRIPIGSGVWLPNGEVIQSSAAYYVVTPEGKVMATFSGPLAYSLDDTLGISDIHRVVGSDLVAYHWIDHAMNEPVVKEEVVLANLRPYILDKLPFDLQESRGSP